MMRIDEIEELVDQPVEVRLEREAKEVRQRRLLQNWMTEEQALSQRTDLEATRRLASLDLGVQQRDNPDLSVDVVGGAFLENLHVGFKGKVVAVAAEVEIEWPNGDETVRWEIVNASRLSESEMPENDWKRRRPVAIFALVDVPYGAIMIQNSHIQTIEPENRLRLLL